MKPRAIIVYASTHGHTAKIAARIARALERAGLQPDVRDVAAADAVGLADYDAAIELAQPDVVLMRAGGAGEVRGIEALREWMEPDAFESQVTEHLGFQIHEERVLSRVRSHARAAGSGIEIDIDSARERFL